MAPTTAPIIKPDLPQSDIPWRSVNSDYFDKDSLGLWWHFLTKKDAAHYSLSAKKGWIRLTPDSGRTSLLQKETDHYYSAVTKVLFNAMDTSTKAGIYLSNGNQKVTVQLYTGFNNNSKEIIFKLDTAIRSIPNRFGNIVWLKIERNLHILSAFCSADGKQWISLGAPISAVSLDKVQPNYNSWVGTSVGLFTEGSAADFDFFICKDGFSSMPVAGYSNYYGVEKSNTSAGTVVSNQSDYGGWLMISGVDLGNNKAAEVILTASASKKGNIEIWLDDLLTGKLIANVPISVTGNINTASTFRKTIKKVSGHHDVFIRFPVNNHQGIFIKDIRFAAQK
jgi:hypothetical protein